MSIKRSLYAFLVKFLYGPQDFHIPWPSQQIEMQHYLPKIFFEFYSNLKSFLYCIFTFDRWPCPPRSQFWVVRFSLGDRFGLRCAMSQFEWDNWTWIFFNRVHTAKQFFADRVSLLAQSWRKLSRKIECFQMCTFNMISKNMKISHKPSVRFYGDP